MTHSTRSSVITPSHLAPTPQHLLPHEESKSELSPIKEYNGAIYKWTQQLLNQIQRHPSSTGGLLKSTAAQNEGVAPLSTAGGPRHKEVEVVECNKFC